MVPAAALAVLLAAFVLCGDASARPIGLLPSGPVPVPLVPLAPARDVAPGTSDGVLVRFKPSAGPEERAIVRSLARTSFRRALPLSGLELDDPQPGLSVGEVLRLLGLSGSVQYAEPNLVRRVAAAPSDPYFPQLWGQSNTGQAVNGVSGTPDADIDAPEAWELMTQRTAPAVAVLDTGLDYLHPDLAPNVWTNPGEAGQGREANGVDDDHNGLVDDWRGWDWIGSRNDPRDGNGHGTHVAGTIAARGQDGFGVAGVSWRSRVMPLRVADDRGYGSVATLIDGYAYAAAEGVRIANVSIASDGFAQPEYDAIAAAPDTLFIVAAGNFGHDNDTEGVYPCNYRLDNVLCVAASDQTDSRLQMSDYGAKSVDLAAPGSNIVSTWPGGGWATLSGTSMAAPHVAGVAALILARRPDLSTSALRQVLLRSVDRKPQFAGITATGGRLNAYRALAEADRALGITVTARPRQRLSRVARHGVRLRARCSDPCVLESTLLLDRHAAKRLRLGTGRRAVIVGAGRSVRTADSATVFLRLTPRAKRRLTRLWSVKLQLRVSAVAVAARGASLASGGSRTTVTKQVELTRPGRPNRRD